MKRKIIGWCILTFALGIIFTPMVILLGFWSAALVLIGSLLLTGLILIGAYLAA